VLHVNSLSGPDPSKTGGSTKQPVRKPNPEFRRIQTKPWLLREHKADPWFLQTSTENQILNVGKQQKPNPKFCKTSENQILNNMGFRYLSLSDFRI